MLTEQAFVLVFVSVARRLADVTRLRSSVEPNANPDFRVLSGIFDSAPHILHLLSAASGHKLVDYASRCIIIPNDAAAPKVTESCAGTFEYMPDGAWKGSGTCTDTYKSGDSKVISWEEGSHLKEYTYKVTGGTGKLQGATGGGTYMYENLTDTLAGGWQKGQVKLP